MIRALAALSLLLVGCAFAWQRPPGTVRALAEWSAVRAEEDSTWADVSACPEPRVLWVATRDEAARRCGPGRWGCVLAPTRRRPYVVAWSGHERPRRLLLWEMTHHVLRCRGIGDRAYRDARIWGPGGFVDRAEGRLSGEGVR